jgi:hypothetical protein
MITYYFFNKTSGQSFKKSTVSYIYERRKYFLVPTLWIVFWLLGQKPNPKAKPNTP